LFAFVLTPARLNSHSWFSCPVQVVLIGLDCCSEMQTLVG